MQTVVGACLLCGSGNKQLFLEKAGKSFVRCRSCGLIYQDPAPEAWESLSFYEASYYESLKERLSAVQEARQPLFDDFLKNAPAFRKTGRILDLGCGSGDFLKKAKTAGWEVRGAEPSREAAREARQALGENISSGTAEDVEFPEGHFDLVTLWNVIDCLPDPLRTLQKAHQWLRPGGALFVRTPNASFHSFLYFLHSRAGSFLQKAGWKREASVFLRQNFNASQLKRLLKQAGFHWTRVQNGKPTPGDAYQVMSAPGGMSAAKSMLYAVSRFFERLTGGRYFLGPNLTAWSVKEESAGRPSYFAVEMRTLGKSFFLHALAILGYLLGLPLWRRVWGARGIQILNYHGVHPLRQNGLNVAPDQFEKQIRFLKENYRIVSLVEAVDTVQSGNLRGPVVALTFDDGYEDNYRLVFPLLKARKIPAAFFILSRKNRRMDHLNENLQECASLLQWEQVREMSEAGMEIGSHGENHVRLNSLSPEKIRAELAGSKAEIEREISRPVRFFSYPYGTRNDFDERIEEEARKAGYEAAFSAIPGMNVRATNPFSFHRTGIEAADTLFTLRAKLNGALGLMRVFETSFFKKMIRAFDSVFLKGIFPEKNKNEASSILLISVDFPPHKDGVSTISGEISTRIAVQGLRTAVIGPADPGAGAYDRPRKYRPFRVLGYEWGYFRMLPLAFLTPWVVWRESVDKILAMNIAYGGVLAWLLSRVSAVQYLIFAYGYEFEKVKSRPLLWSLYLSIYRRAKRIVACSRLVKKRLIQFGAPPEKIEVLYPGVDTEKFKPRGVPREFLEQRSLAGRRILLSVGRLVERKGHDQVIQALPAIVERFSEVVYCVAGAGDQLTALREKVRLLNLENHVRFLGKLSDEELVLFYNACEIFLMPSREIEQGGHLEGFGIVFLEANACGKPVIGGRSGGVLEAIRDGETGFIVDPLNASEISEKVIELLSHPEKADKMGNTGLAWVRESFRWDAYSDQVVKWMKE